MSQLERELLTVRPRLRTMAHSRRRFFGTAWKEQLLGYGFLAPSLVLFGIFLFYPLAKSVYLSLYLTDPRGRIAAFAGFDNYMELLRSGAFYDSLKVTGLFTLYTVPTVIVWGLLLAALTHSRTRGMRFMQLLFSMPVALSVGTASVMWMMMFHPTAGMWNAILEGIGLPPVHWLTDPKWALASVSIMTVWMNIGFTYIVLLSGLKGIPEELYDSAKIDGAGPIRSFLRISLPLLSPTVFFVGIVSVIGAVQSFGQVHILTKGGPMHHTDVVVYSIYQEAFINYRFGTGSARALVLFAIVLLLTVIQYRFFERKVHYQ
ncbi:carbohydrate ABC transporter permease [Gorillibacterium sp. sgz5001074]|uniref:carbohydrate ABC transporter permease n=1 Tax=Gorillibacterium sp. sgz5001074 TaxID=3446695 RepID=UPI003F662A1F